MTYTENLSSPGRRGSGVDLMPGADADGAVPRGAGQGEGLLRFGVGLAGVVVADDGHACLPGRPFLPGQATGSE
jgi:hypothetical protein